MTRIGPPLVALLAVAGLLAVAPPAAGAEVVTLTVSVTTPAGDPVRGVALTATWGDGSATATTTANGKAFVDVPDGADVNVSISHPDYVRNFPHRVEDATSREVSITVYRKADLRVEVADADGPVANARVLLWKGGRLVRGVTTDTDGVVESGTIEAGRYTLAVSKPGYFRERRILDVAGSMREAVRIEQGTVTLRVNVTDDHFDPPKPVGGATIAIEGTGSVTTQPNGVQSVGVPVNSRIDLRVEKEGYNSVDRSIPMGETDRLVDLTIRRTPSISIELLNDRVVVGSRVLATVTDEYDDPVANATVRVDGSSVGWTDAEGELVIEISEAGEHAVHAGAGTLESDRVTVVGVRESTPTATPEPTATPTPSPEAPAGVPGFGFAAALLGLLLAALIAARRPG